MGCGVRKVSEAKVLGWFHVAAGYHIVGDYAVGEHLDNNPLVNLTQMPMGGIWQVVFTIMCLEWLTTYVCKPPAEKPWDILGWSGAAESYDSFLKVLRYLSDSV